ncbi:MAG: Maf family protein [Paracoccaceae bacterium]
MSERIILASSSQVRQSLLQNAGIEFQVRIARIDEDAIRASMQNEGAKLRDIADALAQAKARKISLKESEALVIGCDQVLDLDGVMVKKPQDLADATRQLQDFSGRQHRLHSAVVICQNGEPQWRHVGSVRMQMRELAPEYLAGYLERNWHSIRHSVGCYKLEEEEVRLFSGIEGDYFYVLGLPLIELLGYLTQRRAVPG